MSRFVIPAVVAGVFAAASLAYAATASGTIKNIDMAKDTVTLNNGSTFVAPSTLKLSAFKVGEKVSVTYSQSSGKMRASALTPSS
jgi:Cu/Ag efflux protein CusF